MESNKTLKRILLRDSNSKGFDLMSDDELVDYFNKNNMFLDNQGSDEWQRALIRLRDKFGEIKPNPQTGLGVFPPYE